MDTAAATQIPIAPQRRFLKYNLIFISVIEPTATLYVERDGGQVNFLRLLESLKTT